MTENDGIKKNGLYEVHLTQTGQKNLEQPAVTEPRGINQPPLLEIPPLKSVPIWGEYYVEQGEYDVEQYETKKQLLELELEALRISEFVEFIERGVAAKTADASKAMKVAQVEWLEERWIELVGLRAFGEEKDIQRVTAELLAVYQELQRWSES